MKNNIFKRLISLLIILIIVSLFGGVIYCIITGSKYLLPMVFVSIIIPVAIYLVVLLFSTVCETSNRPYFVELSRGLVWSANLLEIFYYILFFYGCSKLFEKHEFRKGRINAKLSYVIFASLSVLEALFTYLSKTRFVMRDIFFNRFFLYGSWGIQFLLYTFIFVISIMAAKYIQRKIFRMEEREKASLTENEKVSD